jgi:hypothetical protein
MLKTTKTPKEKQLENLNLAYFPTLIWMQILNFQSDTNYALYIIYQFSIFSVSKNGYQV